MERLLGTRQTLNEGSRQLPRSALGAAVMLFTVAPVLACLNSYGEQIKEAQVSGDQAALRDLTSAAETLYGNSPTL